MSTPSPVSAPVNVCIIEDHADFRNTLRQAIDASASLQCENAFSNVEDAFTFLKESPAPNIIVLDLGLPGMDGIEAIPLLRELAPEAKVLILTVFENKTRVFQALGAGASGYLMKASGIKSIIQGIEDAYNGIAPLSSEIAQMVFKTFSAFKPTTEAAEISDREIEVLRKLADGATRIEISTDMGLSPHTIDSHVRNIYRKLHVHNVSGAIMKAAAMHII